MVDACNFQNSFFKSVKCLFYSMVLASYSYENNLVLRFDFSPMDMPMLEHSSYQKCDTFYCSFIVLLLNLKCAGQRSKLLDIVNQIFSFFATVVNIIFCLRCKLS